MAADDLKTEYHLTPDGWVPGTRRSFGELSGDQVERPQGALETWEEHIYQRSIWSDETVSSRRLWCDESVPEETRRALDSKFKRPFRG